MSHVHLKSNNRISLWSTVAFAVSLVVAQQLPAQADRWRDPYARMQLSDEQRQQISGFQRQWQTQYARLKPQLRRQQEKLVTLLSDGRSDPLEITQTQQRISSLQEQLTNQATFNVLQKRRVLKPHQRQQLRQMLNGSMVVETRSPRTL